MGSQLTCCRLRDVHLRGLLLLGQQRRHAAQLGEAAAATAAAGGQASTLQLLGLHLADVRGVGGRGGLGAEGGGCVGARSCMRKERKSRIRIRIRRTSFCDPCGKKKEGIKIKLLQSYLTVRCLV